MTPESAPPGPATAERRRVWRLGGVLTVAIFVAYAGSLRGGFVFEDVGSILADNPTIRHLWPLWGPDGSLHPPGGLAVSGHPLANFTLALNYAFGRFDPAGYHLVNLALHAAAALALFGVVRRTLLLRSPAAGAAGPNRRRPAVSTAALLGFAVALLWALHPLQTGAVTCVVQRAEVLAGLGVLGSLYAFLRAEGVGDDATPPNGFRLPRRLWQAISMAAALAGMASRATAVVAPLLVFLYDATFLAGSGRAAWWARRGSHLALAAAWLLPVALAALPHRYADAEGFAPAVSAWSQLGVLGRSFGTYLSLTVWPHPLVLDRGYAAAPGFGPGALSIGLVAVALGATAWGIRRRSPLGFAGVWCLASLALASDFGRDAVAPIAESRLYLPLAGLVAAAVLTAWIHLGRGVLAGAFAVAAVLGAATVLRNGDYASATGLWRLTARQAPANGRAELNLGRQLLRDGQPAAALPHFVAALRLAPDNRRAHFEIARALVQLRRLPEAEPFFAEAVRRNPADGAVAGEYAESLAWFGRLADALPWYERAMTLAPRRAAIENSLAVSLTRNGRAADAVPHYQAALRLEPDDPEAASNLGDALAALGRPAEAAAAYERSLALEPGYAAHTGLAKVLLNSGRALDAIDHFSAALDLRPDAADTLVDLAIAYMSVGRDAEAAPRLDAALRLEPAHPRAHTQLGLLLARNQQPTTALAHFEAVVQAQPSDPAACRNLGRVLFQLGRYEEAAACFTQVLNLAPGAPAHTDVADALVRCARYDEAAAHYEAALQLEPGYAPAAGRLAELRRLRAATAPDR